MTTMTVTHNELIDYGCKFEKRSDADGVVRSGYWLDDVFLGTTPRDATEAIRG